MCGAVHCSDIAILGVHTRPPRIDHDELPKICEIPTLVVLLPDRRPSARRRSTASRRSRSIEEQCMYCGNCYTVCPSVKINNPKTDGVSIWVGGKVSNARARADVLEARDSVPAQQPAALARGRRRGQEHRRASTRRTPASTSGWASGSSGSAGRRSSSSTGIPFTKYHIDDFNHAGETYKRSAQLRH